MDAKAISERAERAYELHMADDTVWQRDYPDIGHDYFCDVEALMSFRRLVLAAFMTGNLSCSCMGIIHEATCPIGSLEIEAEQARGY